METRIALMEGLADVMEFADMELQSSGIATCTLFFMQKYLFVLFFCFVLFFIYFFFLFSCKMYVRILQSTYIPIL